ncbi:MAG TPA: Wzz/FepE/Etk N-terminal domain-containing protein [Flavisolibacter sp.]|nr:Wzz/FepE/Etk N-terminal domain-containing protein [Flavisolibacter sp.]
MNENKEEQFSLGDLTTSMRRFLVYLRRRILLFIITIVIGASLGLLFYFMQKPEYEAVTTFILEEKSAGGGGLAGIASQFGFDIGGLTGGGSIFAGDNILEILRSKKIIYTVLLSKASADTAGNAPTLADAFLDFQGWRKKWERQELKNISYANAGKGLSSLQDSVLSEIHKYLVKRALSADRVNKKGSIIEVEVKAANSDFARFLAERIVDESAKLYLQIKTGTAQANIAKLQRRSDSLLVLLNQKSYTAAASQSLDLNPGIKTALVPTEIISRDKTVISTLYAEVTKNLEASKMLLSQQTPVIQLLDRPGYLLKDDRKSLAFSLVVFSIVAAGLYLFAALMLFYFFQLKSVQ